MLTGNDSWHNGATLSFGDKVLGQEVQSVMDGPDWASTAIFITWNDCGCFYDHVSPRRVPMVIVSPYARAGFTDDTPVTFAGVHRFIEESLGLPSMNAMDASAYDYGTRSISVRRHSHRSPWSTTRFRPLAGRVSASRARWTQATPTTRPSVRAR